MGRGVPLGIRSSLALLALTSSAAQEGAAYYVVRVFAGGNQAGYSGDLGQAINAKLNGPWGVSGSPCAFLQNTDTQTPMYHCDACLSRVGHRNSFTIATRVSHV